MAESSIWGAGAMSGPPGPPGPAATIQVGTVTTGAAGTPVIIVNAGTSSAAIFNFTIPRGDPGIGTQGPVGPAGESIQGPEGPQGASGPTGPAGANGATIIAGTGAPLNSQGNDGDYYLDQVNALLYGPKVSGVWSGSFINLIPALASTISPADAFTGVIGTSVNAARQDHVHPFPTVVFEDFTPLTGTAITIANNTDTAVIAPAGTLATLTINLPPAVSAFNGKIVEIYIQGFAITTPTTQATGCTIRTPLPASATGGYRFRFRSSNTTWYRIN